MDVLLHAIKNNDIAEVKNLLIKNRETVMKVGLSYLYKFVNDTEMLRTLYNTWNTDNRSFLVEAIRKGNDLKMVESLMEPLAKFMDCEKWQNWALLNHAAKRYQLFSSLKLWLQINAHLRRRFRPFFDRTEECIDLFLKYSGQMDFKNKFWYKPLMTAIKENRMFILDLIKIGADVEACDENGKTCLHLALYFNFDEDVIDQICSKTDDYNTEDDKGLTPLCYAIDETNAWPGLDYRSEFIYKLINKGFIMNNKVFIHAVKHCDRVELISGLSKYVDIRCLDEYRNCVLHLAQDFWTIDVLARRGAPINHVNDGGMTPLMLKLLLSFSFGSVNYYHLFKDTIEILLYRGADIRGLDYLLNDFAHAHLLIHKKLLYSFISYGMNLSLKRKYVSMFLSQVFHIMVEDGDFDSLWDCSRGLLRHIFLSNENILVPDQLKENYIIKTYNGELNKMKGELITENLSYYDFCMKQYRSIKSPFGRKGFRKADEKKIKNLFPIFYDDVIVKIRINIRINRHKLFLKKLMQINLGKRREKDDEHSSFEYVVLDCDSMDILGSFMNERDVKCLLAAAIIDSRYEMG